MSTRTSSKVSARAFLRHRTTCCLVLTLAGAAASTPATAGTSAESLRTQITVRVYQAAGLSSALEQRALSEAEAVLRPAFVDVRWQECTRQQLSDACDAPRSPAELLLRVVRQGVPPKYTPPSLGNALIVRCEGGSVLATVYFDRVASVAKTAETDVAVLLGRVAAHELGHLLMHTSEHAPSGLMRANWTPDEIRRNHALDWVFTTADVKAMRRQARPH